MIFKRTSSITEKSFVENKCTIKEFYFVEMHVRKVHLLPISKVILKFWTSFCCTFILKQSPICFHTHVLGHRISFKFYEIQTWGRNLETDQYSLLCNNNNDDIC